jgi:hypothetical protein
VLFFINDEIIVRRPLRFLQRAGSIPTMPVAMRFVAWKHKGMI